MNSNKLIPIFFAIDNDYAPYLSVAIASLIENASKDYDYVIHIIHQELSEENKRRLGGLARDGFEIVFTEMADCLRPITDRVENHLRKGQFTLTIYFRLFLADMFPQYDKGIYLDSDIVVPGDISRLYATELPNDKAFAACSDLSIQNIPILVNYLENAVGVPRMEYINSGVLVMNFKFFREHDFAHRFLELLGKWHFDSVAPDQDYLNAMCSGRIVYLDKSWDVMPQKSGEKLASPNLIHYNLFDKPWCVSGVQYEEYFWDYAERSAYYKDILNHKKSHTEDKIEADRQGLATLIDRADKLVNADITFKKLSEKGVKIKI